MSGRCPKTIRSALAALALVAGAAGASLVSAEPLPTTTEDFRLPGTQPLSISHDFPTPSACTNCHSDYGDDEVEPFRNWQGSMMAQSGRDPITWAAIAIANQDAANSGEVCLRCHLPKGWLEGRSAEPDGSMMTADDRQGVQCSVCHRMVDPFPDPNNPSEDAAILAALAEPVPVLGNAMMVMDPFDNLRGPFDITPDPHPTRDTIVSPFHKSSELCGVCHNLRNPAFTLNDLTGKYELNPIDTPGDPAKGFPEQLTYDEWKHSEYATQGVYAPQFGANEPVVFSCQDCHMPAVTGRDAVDAVERDDLPLHEMVGANALVPRLIPHHPVFGDEVDAEILERGAQKSEDMLRRAATLSARIESGELIVRVTNETGHKLPTGYPEGRRMWLHVRAMDARRNVVFESGRYVHATSTLVGHHVDPNDPRASETDPYLHVWESEQGISPELAAQIGQPAGPSFHLVLNDTVYKDNRIPPRGFTNAGFESFNGAPVGASYADGQYWDDVVYPVGPDATRAEVTLNYQTTSREYIEFLRDANQTNAAGFILHDLWEQYGRTGPVEMARTVFDKKASLAERCRNNVAKVTKRYQKKHLAEWTRCYDTETRGLSCDEGRRDERLAAEQVRLRARLGGEADRTCAQPDLAPSSLGLGSSCPVPCVDITLTGFPALADCVVCLAESVNHEVLDAAYGVVPPFTPGRISSSAEACQKNLSRSGASLATRWSSALRRCAKGNAKGGAGPSECTADTEPRIAKAIEAALRPIERCSSFSSLEGCAEAAGDARDVQECFEAALEVPIGGLVEVVHP